MAAGGIIYLEPNGIRAYIHGHDDMPGLTFPREASHDMEVVNRAALEKSIAEFMAAANIQSQSFVILLSPDVCFEKKLESERGGSRADEIKQFTDVVPFESVRSVEIPTKDGDVFVATSEDYFTAVADALSRTGHTVHTVIPYYIVAADGYDSFDANAAKYVLKHADAYRKHAFDTEPEESEQAEEFDADTLPAKQPKSQLPLLLGIFAVLILILVIMILFQKGAF